MQILKVVFTYRSYPFKKRIKAFICKHFNAGICLKNTASLTLKACVNK